MPGDRGQYRLCKIMQCIVTGTHDNDPVSRPGDAHHSLTAFLSHRDMLGSASGSDYRFDYRIAPSRPVNRAAEVYRVAQNDMVILIKIFRENCSKLSPHFPDRAKAMRLEKCDYAARKRLECAQGGSDLVRIMTKIIDHSDLARSSDYVEAASQPA